MMCPVIDNPASCKIHAIVHFLFTKNINAAEIRLKFFVVYVQNVLSEGTVRQWCRMFRNG
jgi:hypothetical protein